jgi:hypothetical protein
MEQQVDEGGNHFHHPRVLVCLFVIPGHLIIHANSCHSMITIAVFVLIAFHPGFGFQNQFNALHYESANAEGTSKEAFSLIAVDDLQRPKTKATVV